MGSGFNMIFFAMYSLLLLQTDVHSPQEVVRLPVVQPLEERFCSCHFRSSICSTCRQTPRKLTPSHNRDSSLTTRPGKGGGYDTVN